MGTLASELRPIAARLTPAPRVYADANLPWGIVSFMRHELGWDVLFVLEDEEFRRAPDAVHYRRAFDLGRTLITLDRDFFDDKHFPPAESPGVVVCSAPDEPALRRLLAELDAAIFRPAVSAELPLRGRKLAMTSGVVLRKT